MIRDAARRRFLSLEVPRGARVLDAPCGDGSITAELRAAGYDAHGIDAVDSGGSSALGAAFHLGDLNAPIPWPDSSFDAALSIEGIEHLENRFAFLRELHRVLKPGAPLLVTTPNIASLRSRVRFFGSTFYHRDTRPLREAARHPLHHIALATPADLRYALHTSGFRLTAVGHTHIKPVSYAYAWLAPWMWIYTTVAFRKETDPTQRRANREIRSALFSKSVLFGENLMLTCLRDAREAQRAPDYSGEIDGRPQSSQRR